VGLDLTFSIRGVAIRHQRTPPEGAAAPALIAVVPVDADEGAARVSTTPLDHTRLRVARIVSRRFSEHSGFA
jgi:hypothetical protein